MTAELVDPEVELDPRRWIILAILLLTVVLIAIDTSVLNVSIPTILREMHTTVPTLEWVIAGYSLTFASLLIVVSSASERRCSASVHSSPRPRRMWAC